jgi:hypothetical protein
MSHAFVAILYLKMPNWDKLRDQCYAGLSFLADQRDEAQPPAAIVRLHPPGMGPPERGSPRRSIATG